MAGVRVIAGKLKGRLIPFDNRKFDDADITPQRVKGALFSMIGEWLYEKGFLDLYAGSGQVGLEALSRGADPVVFNDTDIKRHQFIKSYCAGIGIEPMPMILNLTTERALAFLKLKRYIFHYIFLDPPYEMVRAGVLLHHDLIQGIADSGILAGDGSIILQHFSRNIMDEAIGPCRLETTKIYGKTALSVYSIG
ncbi:MAG: RsmD family RNA methyltransferase [Spirochaetes bacterium]|nr:RsmD family RNA methyltransferase [Spirochaetota bacterium]